MESDSPALVALFAAHPLGLGLFRLADDRFARINPVFATLFGCEPDELLGLSLRDLGLDPVATEAALSERLRSGESVRQSPVLARRPDGRTLTLLVSAAPLELEGRHFGLLIVQPAPPRPPADATLQANEERYRLLVEQNVDGILVHDSRLRYVEVNPAACRMLGYSREELLTRSVPDMVVAEEFDRIAPAEARFAAGETTPRAFRCRRKDGTTFIGEVTGGKLPDGRFLGILRDITERSRAEQALKASEAKFRTLFESLDQGFCIVDLIFDETGQASDLRFLLVNPAFERTLQLPGATGRRILEMVPDLDRRWIERFGEVAGTGTAQRFEQRFAPLQRDFEVHAFPVGEPDGRQVGVLFNDVTARQQIEAALRTSEKRFRAVFEHAGIGIAITDLEGGMVDCNPAFQALLGCDLEELRQQRFADLIHPEDREANLVESRRLLEGRLTFFEIENRYRRKDGEAIWVRKFISLLRDSSGAPTHFLALVTDMTERRDLEAALRQADRHKDEFLAVLAHELRNPLAPLRTGLHLLQRPGASGPPAAEIHAMMHRQLEHLVRLVDDLLEVSRITRGKVELKRERIDLAEAIRHALETSQPLIEAGNHRLSVRLPAAPLPVHADGVRLTQVFANLLNNAAKYTETGGEIRLTAECRDGQAAVGIRDTGLGIPAAMLPRVFDLFTQVDRSLGRAHGGLGIGLALVRRLVEMHGGRVEARSEGLGRGSEFQVWLPLDRSEEGRTDADMPPRPPTRPFRRILVVDDNRDDADSLVVLLRSPDAEVRVAYDGAGALRAVEEFRPEIAFLDLGMPGLDGYETARRLRRRPDGADLKLVALTGWGQEEDRRLSREAGFDHHLVKPVDLDRLLALLQPEPDAGP